MKNKAIFVFEGLLAGQIICIGQKDYRLVDGQLYEIDNFERIPTRLSIVEFIKLCNEGTK